MLELAKPFLNNETKKTAFIKKLQHTTYKSLSIKAFKGREVLQSYAVKKIEDKLRERQDRSASHKSINKIIAIGDDTKSGRIYGKNVSGAKFLYDYVKDSRYFTIQVYVLLISIGKHHFIADFVFKDEDKNGCKTIFNMLQAFIKRLDPELRESFKKEVICALDGFYGKLKAIEDYVISQTPLVVKSGGNQKVIVPKDVKTSSEATENKSSEMELFDNYTSETISLTELKKWLIKNNDFKKINPCHKLDADYTEIVLQTKTKLLKLKFVLYRFKKKSSPGYRYILLITNQLDWHAFRVLQAYKGRWSVETMFRTVKQKLSFKQHSFHFKNMNGSPNKDRALRSFEMFFSMRFILYMVLNQYRVEHTKINTTQLKTVVEGFCLELNSCNSLTLSNLFSLTAF